jgi:hypothetical protein
MTSKLAALVVSALLAPSCASAAPVIDRPSRPIYLCIHIRPHRHKRNCLRFDARRLLGLNLVAAAKLARQYGYTLRRERPLAQHECLTMDYDTGRIDVETDAPNVTSTVIRIIQRG